MLNRISIVFFACIFMSANVLLFAQQPSLPKRAPKQKLQWRSFGTKPGSKVPADGDKTAAYKRVYYHPATLHLVVRTNCGTRPTKQELVDRAAAGRSSVGKPLLLDWEKLKSDKVTYWVVISSTRETLDVDLVDKDGKYMIAGDRRSKKEYWHVQTLRFSKFNGDSCVNWKELANKELVTPIINILNSETLKRLRGGEAEQ